jgi:hypothetical protein
VFPKEVIVMDVFPWLCLHSSYGSNLQVSADKQFANPVDVFVDALHGMVYVMDQEQHRVQVWTAYR